MVETDLTAAPEIKGCPELAVRQLLGYLVGTRDDLSAAIISLTEQRDRFDRRIAEAEVLLVGRF